MSSGREFCDRGPRSEQRSLIERVVQARAGLSPIAALAMLISTPSFAQSNAGPIELTLFGGIGFGGTFETQSGTNIEVDDGSTVGLIFDYEEGPDTQWEVLYLKQNTSVDTLALGALRPSIDTEIHYLQGGGTYGAPMGGFRPYLSGTAGLTYVNPKAANTRSDTFLSLSIGGGVQFRKSERLGFRLEGRVFGTLVDSDSAIYCGSVPGQSQCLITLKGNVMWQGHVFAGVTFRF